MTPNFYEVTNSAESCRLSNFFHSSYSYGHKHVAGNLCITSLSAQYISHPGLGKNKASHKRGGKRREKELVEFHWFIDGMSELEKFLE